jgi:hypothetical protein
MATYNSLQHNFKRTVNFWKVIEHHNDELQVTDSDNREEASFDILRFMTNLLVQFEQSGQMTDLKMSFVLHCCLWAIQTYD